LTRHVLECPRPQVSTVNKTISISIRFSEKVLNITLLRGSAVEPRELGEFRGRDLTSILDIDGFEEALDS